MRNYVLSHTSAVFESSYQPLRARSNLMFLAFRNGAGTVNDLLFDRLRDVSLSRDEDAPVMLSVCEESEFEQCRDMTDLRAKLAAAPTKEKAALRRKLERLLDTLFELKLKANWMEYFNRVDFLRARGLPTTNNPPVDRSTTLGAEAPIAQFLIACIAELAIDIDDRKRIYL